MELLQGKQVSVSWRLSLKHQNGEKIIKGEREWKNKANRAIQSACCSAQVTQETHIFLRTHSLSHLLFGLFFFPGESLLSAKSGSHSTFESAVCREFVVRKIKGKQNKQN